MHINKRWQSFIAGIISMLGFAPLHLWPLTLAGCTYLVDQTTLSPKRARLQGFYFGLGFFGAGVYWIIHSVHDYGHNNWGVSALVSLLLIGYLSLYPMLVTDLCARQKDRYLPMIVFWTIAEYTRAHFATGFPWLLIGYTQTFGPLHHLAPYLGIFGISAATMATACLLHRMFSCHTVEQCLKIFVFFVIMVGLLWFPGHPWTKPKGTTLSIAMVQGNFQDKWSTPLATQLGRYIDLSPKTTQVVLWPEAALPVSDDSITDTLNDMQHFFQTRQQTLATGLITHQHGQWFNSVRLFGKDQGLINKRHLVPFGEYVPTLLRPFLHWLPGGMGTMHAGSYHQSTLALHGVPISTLICYEVAYPELVRTQSQRTELLVTFNDSHWFGPSFAASQQLEMAVMRSQELQKPMLYVSNTGWTVHINAMGRIVQALPNNRPGMLRILAQPHIGQTPYAYYGDHLILGLSMLGLLFIFREKSKKDTKVAR